VLLGPVQLLVLGFNDPDFGGAMLAELERLPESGAVRVLDSLAVFKDAAGEIEVEHLSAPGKVLGALIGLGVEGEEDLELTAETAAEPDEQDGWDVLQDIPNDTAAALVLIEHAWAVPLREAIVRADGFRISDGFISPLDLVEVGLVTAAEADALQAIETGAA
jgi:hypothetical protein